jgi:AAA domain
VRLSCGGCSRPPHHLGLGLTAHYDLLSLARALGGEVKSGQVLCPGPGHSAVDRSLSIKLDDAAPDGFIVHSFAGDDPIRCKNYVRAKAGIPNGKPHGRKQRASEDEIAKLIMAAAAMAPQKPSGQHVATFDYIDEKGTLLYQVLKYDNPRHYQQRRPNGNGGWIWNLDDTPRVIYRRQDFLKWPDATAFICEGEKDADRVASLDHCATTVASGKWTDECVEALVGRDCIILEDNDDAGRAKALAAAHALHGGAKTIRIVRLPDLPGKGDVSDWLDADPRRAEKFVDICFNTPLWAPGNTEEPQSYAPNDQEGTKENTTEPPPSPWRFHSEAEPEPTAWLIKNLLPETGTGLISGQWGAYKTTSALDLAVSIMAAIPFAMRFPVKRQGGVAYLALEGVGGLASRLTAIARTRGVTGALPFAYRPDCPPLTSRDALNKLTTMIEDAARHLKDRFDVPLVAVFVDTLITAAGYAKAGDDNDTASAQRIMSVLGGLSQYTGALALGLDHFGKIADTGTRGSSAKEGHADVVLALLADRELNGAVTNTRLAIRKLRDGLSGLEIPFTPKTVEIGTDLDGDPITRVVIDWSGQPTHAPDKDWSKSLRLLRRILMATLVTVGKEVCPFLDGPTVRACDLAAVKTEFNRQYTADGNDRQRADTRRKAFYRAVTDAQAKGLVATREVNGIQLIWLATKTEEGIP